MASPAKRRMGIYSRHILASLIGTRLLSSIDSVNLRLMTYALPIPTLLFYSMCSITPSEVFTNSRLVLALTGCVSNSPGIPNVFLLRLQSQNGTSTASETFQVRVGYFGNFSWLLRLTPLASANRPFRSMRWPTHQPHVLFNNRSFSTIPHIPLFSDLERHSYRRHSRHLSFLPCSSPPVKDLPLPTCRGRRLVPPRPPLLAAAEAESEGPKRSHGRPPAILQASDNRSSLVLCRIGASGGRRDHTNRWSSPVFDDIRHGVICDDDCRFSPSDSSVARVRLLCSFRIGCFFDFQVARWNGAVCRRRY